MGKILLPKNAQPYPRCFIDACLRQGDGSCLRWGLQENWCVWRGWKRWSGPQNTAKLSSPNTDALPWALLTYLKSWAADRPAVHPRSCQLIFTRAGNGRKHSWLLDAKTHPGNIKRTDQQLPWAIEAWMREHLPVTRRLRLDSDFQKLSWVSSADRVTQPVDRHLPKPRLQLQLHCLLHKLVRAVVLHSRILSSVEVGLSLSVTMYGEGASRLDWLFSAS